MYIIVFFKYIFRHAYYIREIDAVFTSGQLCPLYEVPSPNSKRVGDFLKNFFQVIVIT